MKCEICEKDIIGTPWHYQSCSFCSQECVDTFKKRDTKCKQCGLDCYLQFGEGKFCSQKCMNEYWGGVKWEEVYPDPMQQLLLCDSCGSSCTKEFLLGDKVYCSAECCEGALKSLPPNPLNTQVGGSHYKKYAIQPVEYCQKNQLNFLESMIIKYATRHRDKNGREDIEKIIHASQLLLELEYED